MSSDWVYVAIWVSQITLQYDHFQSVVRWSRAKHLRIFLERFWLFWMPGKSKLGFALLGKITRIMFVGRHHSDLRCEWGRYWLNEFKVKCLDSYVLGVFSYIIDSNPYSDAMRETTPNITDSLEMRGFADRIRVILKDVLACKLSEAKRIRLLPNSEWWVFFEFHRLNGEHFYNEDGLERVELRYRWWSNGMIEPWFCIKPGMVS